MRILLIILMTLLLLSSTTYSDQSQPLGYREVEAVVTAYNENDGYTPGTTMANGEQVHYGALANDVLPLGTRVIIDNEIFTVKDRFGEDEPKLERFDMYLTSRGDCDRWGVQRKNIKIMEDNNEN